MAENKIEVEYITTVAGALNAIEKLNKRLDAQEQKLQKVGDTSKKAAEGAVGSFNKLEQELKENEAALKKLAIGTAQYDAQKSKVDALRRSLNGAKKEVEAMGGGAAQAISSAATKMIGFAAGVVTVQKAIEVIVFELEKAKRLRIEAGAETRTVEQAIARMAPNIGAANVERARQMVAENAPRLGVTQEGLAGMFGNAISAGAKDLDEALMLSAKTLAVTAGNAQDASPIMSGLLTLAAQTGNRNWDELLGQFSKFQEAGRGEEMSQSIKNMSTAMAAANIRGERLAPLGGERTLELGAAISQRLQDPQMDITGTALRQLFLKMDEFVPQEKVTLDDKTESRLPKDQIAAFNKLGTLDERIKAMQDNPELARQFLSRIEANQVKPAIRSLVTADPTMMQMVKTAEGLIGSGRAAEAEGKALTAAVLEQTPNLKAFNMAAAGNQAVDVGSRRAAEGTAIEILTKAMEKADLPGLDFVAEKATRDAVAMTIAQGGNVAQTGINLLTRMKGGGDASDPFRAGVSEEDQRRFGMTIEILRGQKELIDLLKAKETAEAEKKQQQPVPVNVKVQAPAARPKVAPLPASTAP